MQSGQGGSLRVCGGSKSNLSLKYFLIHLEWVVFLGKCTELETLCIFLKRCK